MSRSWWFRGLLLLLLVSAAVIVLIPTVVPHDSQPKIIQRYLGRSMHPALEIHGGVRLVYEVDLEVAIAMQTDSAAHGMEQILRGEYPGLRFEVERQGGTDVIISAPRLQPELSYRHVMRAAADWLVEVERDDRRGRILLRFDPAKTKEVHEAAIRAGMEAIESRMNPFRCWGESLAREGDRIVLEFPGLRQGESVRSPIRTSPPLRFFTEEPISQVLGIDAGSDEVRRSE